MCFFFFTKEQRESPGEPEHAGMNRQIKKKEKRNTHCVHLRVLVILTAYIHGDPVGIKQTEHSVNAVTELHERANGSTIKPTENRSMADSWLHGSGFI